MSLHRVAIAALLALALAAAPLRGFALSTAAEVALGKGIERSIDAQSGLVHDPLLEPWVQRIFGTLTAGTHRRDIAYQVKILDSETPNAFALPGGTVYVTKGMLNFVHSNDELAAVLGHEIGHVEHYHASKMYDEVRGANTLITLAKIFSPLVSRFGDLAEGLFLLKVSRFHELQADRYGLQALAAAGYDPKAMHVFLHRLGEFFGERGGALGKYFATHPGTRDRIAHVAGYPELDRVPAALIGAAAGHDADEGRYGFAYGRALQALQLDPAEPAALAARERAAAALGLDAEPARAPLDSPQPGAAPSPTIEEARRELRAAKSAVAERVKLGKDELRWVQYALDSLEYDVALDGTGGIAGVADDTRLGRLLRRQLTLTRNLDHALNEALDTFAQAPALIEDARAIIEAIAARTGGARGASAQAVTGAARASARDLVRAVATARSTIAAAYAQRASIAAYMSALNAVKHYPKGDLAQSDADRLAALLERALVASEAAFEAGTTASDALNFAQARGTWAHLALLELDRTPQQLAAYRALLQVQFQTAPPSALQADELGAAPADLAVAVIVAAAAGDSAAAVLSAAARAGVSLIEEAIHRRIAGETLQLALGIVWTAYTDTGAAAGVPPYKN